MTLPKITPRQQDILKLIYKHRFLDRAQIQALLQNKDAKNIKEWLTDLREKEYLNWIYSTDYHGRTKPAIYFIGLNGIKYLKTQDDCTPELVRRLYREKSRSDSFRASCLLLGDCAVGLNAPRSDGATYDYATLSDFAKPASPLHVLAGNNCQLFFTKYTAEGELIARFMLQVIDSTLPLYRARKRIRDCISFYTSGDWESATGTAFPAALFVCPSLDVLISLKRYTRYLLKQADGPEGLHIRFTTMEKLQEQGVTAGIWEEA